MDERTMPLATFRDDETGEQLTVRLTYHRREQGKPDRMLPHPRRRGRELRLVQIQYYDAAGG